MRRRVSILSALVCLSIAAPGGATPALPAAPPPLGPVIVRLVQRHQVIVTRAGRHGPTYSLESKTGQVLSPDMTMDQLATRNPQLHGQIRSLQDAVTWAGVDTGD
jgi:hypothetical protein